MSKKRIVHLLCMNSYSGAENVACQIIEMFKEDHDVEMVYVSPRGTIERVLEDRSINYYPIERVCYKEIKRVMKVLNPDIIHAHDLRASIFASMCKSNKCISHLHKNDPDLKRISTKSLLYFASLHKYEKVLIVSESVRNEFIFAKPYNAKFLCIGNPLNINDIRQKSIEDDSFELYDVGFIGRLEVVKNPLNFLKIILLIKKDIPDIKVCIIGDGSLKNEIKEFIHRNHLESNIALKGFQKNPYILMKNTKVVCVPSLWEGFGLSAVEALALGKPVVCSDVGGLPTIINDLCGRVCSEFDEYCEEIIRLLTDSEYYKKKQIGANNRAEQLDNIVRYKKVLTEIYKKNMK